MGVIALNDHCDQPIPLFSVCAEEKRDKGRAFIVHIGLSGSAQNCRRGENIAWIHMRPPFKQNEDCETHFVGTMKLDVDECRAIQVFIERYKQEMITAHANNDRRKQYVIHPCKLPATKNHSCRRYSCAGFVLDAYDAAGIPLINEFHKIPDVDLLFLSNVYGNNSLNHIQLREYFGLSGSGPWPVVLPGYVLNSFNRSDGEIRENPFCPGEADAYFQ